ncbi:MAG: hypothetical protein RBS56_00580 [Candidatus Gracilibacteria bacterium]|jgi:hypothetical protein|nr:hypothetical protein [Candidatus Gracilibacteria bacterium]
MTYFQKPKLIKTDFSISGAVFGIIFYVLIFWLFVSLSEFASNSEVFAFFLKITGLIFPFSLKHTDFFPQLIAVHLLLASVYSIIFSFIFKKTQNQTKNNLPLQGGIIASSIYLLSLMLAYILLIQSSDEIQNLIISISIFNGHAYPFFSIGMFPDTSPYVAFFGVLLIITILYFMIGASIGKLIEIWKNRRIKRKISREERHKK